MNSPPVDYDSWGEESDEDEEEEEYGYDNGRPTYMYPGGYQGYPMYHPPPVMFGPPFPVYYPPPPKYRGRRRGRQKPPDYLQVFIIRQTNKKILHLDYINL